MTAREASLEALVETGILPGTTFHPGGQAVTHELAELCGIRLDDHVLDVACGAGETACVLAERYGCAVVGIDATERQVDTARANGAARGLPVEFHLADAHALPFPDGSFDVTIAEAILCHLDIDGVLREMVRVTKPGGAVGTHDLCWKPGAPDRLKARFAEVEDERPETLAGWAERFRRAGLVEVRTVDKSGDYPQWLKEDVRRIGFGGQLRILGRVLRRWGVRGFLRIRESQKIWESPHMGYGIVAGVKPKVAA